MNFRLFSPFLFPLPPFATECSKMSNSQDFILPPSFFYYRVAKGKCNPNSAALRLSRLLHLWKNDMAAELQSSIFPFAVLSPFQVEEVLKSSRVGKGKWESEKQPNPKTQPNLSTSLIMLHSLVTGNKGGERREKQ